MRKPTLLVTLSFVSFILRGANNEIYRYPRIADVGPSVYEKLTASGRRNLEAGEKELGILPGVSKLRWVVENKIAQRPEVVSSGAQRWAWMEIKVSADGSTPTAVRQAAAEWRHTAIEKNLLESGTVLRMQPVYPAYPSQAPQTSSAGKNPDDPMLDRQTGLDLVNVRPLWALPSVRPAISMPRVAVAIMDTGIKCSHLDLFGVIDESNSRSFVDTPACEPTTRHATQVDGIAAAVANNGVGIAGVAQGVPVLDWKIFRWGVSSDGKKVLYTDDEIILRAFWATLDLPYERVILNCSFQSESQDSAGFWEKTMSGLKDKVLVVGGAGNSNADTSKVSVLPGTLSYLGNVICLTAIDSQGKYSGFTGVGKRVEIAAPGVNVLTTDDSVSGYTSTESGVSLAIPFVTGTAAMLAKNADQLPSPALLKGSILSGASLNLNLQGLMPVPRQLNGWRAWLALNGQLGNEVELTTKILGVDDGDGDDKFAPAPWSWITIRGTQLSGDTYTSGIPLPTTLGGVRILLDGEIALPLLCVYPDRIDVQMHGDFRFAPGRHTLTYVRVDRDGFPILGSMLSVAEFISVSASPAVRALLRSNGTVVWDQNPVLPGETLKFLLTGLGKTSPVVQPGDFFRGTEVPAAAVKLYMNGEEIPVQLGTYPGGIGIYTAVFTMPRVETLYNAVANICTDDICAEYWFNYDGAQ